MVNTDRHGGIDVDSAVLCILVQLAAAVVVMETLLCMHVARQGVAVVERQLIV